MVIATSSDYVSHYQSKTNQLVSIASRNRTFWSRRYMGLSFSNGYGDYIYYVIFDIASCNIENITCGPATNISSNKNHDVNVRTGTMIYLLILVLRMTLTSF